MTKLFIGMGLSGIITLNFLSGLFKVRCMSGWVGGGAGRPLVKILSQCMSAGILGTVSIFFLDLLFWSKSWTCSAGQAPLTPPCLTPFSSQMGTGTGKLD